MLDPRKLRKHRLKANLSQEQLAFLCGWKSVVITRMESKLPIDFFLASIEKVAAQLGVEVNELLTPGPLSDRALCEMPTLRKSGKRRRKIPVPVDPLPDDPADDIIVRPKPLSEMPLQQMLEDYEAGRLVRKDEGGADAAPAPHKPGANGSPAPGSNGAAAGKDEDEERG